MPCAILLSQRTRRLAIHKAAFHKTPLTVLVKGCLEYGLRAPHRYALGLGSTAMFAVTLVYNTRRSGEFQLGGRRFLLRRVYFPENPTAEWFIVDLLQHHDMAGVALSELRVGLVATLRSGRWDRDRLREMAKVYGTKATLAVVDECLRLSLRG